MNDSSREAPAAPAARAAGLRVYRRLLGYARPHLGMFLIGVAGMAMFAGTNWAYAKLVQVFLNGTFVERDPSVLWFVPGALILLFFLLATEYHLVWRAVAAVARPRARALALSGIREAQRDIGRFLTTMTRLNIGLGVATGLALHAIGLPNPILWGTLAAVLNFIFYIGPVLMTVLLLMAGISLMSEGRLESVSSGLRLFPIVILALTVERFWIIQEEADLATAFRILLGTLATVTAAYLVINVQGLLTALVRHPESLLIVIGVMIPVGRWNGMRLSEYLRFRQLLRPGGAP